MARSAVGNARSGSLRLDQTLVERGLFDSREKARRAVMAGLVEVAGRRIDKPGTPISADAPVQVLAPAEPYVSRGGRKLRAALDFFALDPSGWRCLDVGASTGGFTDCLLQRGAQRVHAIDVGSGQLDWKLRNDPRVVVHEGVNARYLKPEEIGEPVALAVCDVSFISATLIVPVLDALVRRSGELVILVKPQFEVGRGLVGKGGIVRDPALHLASCEKVESVVKQLGYATAVIESPIAGAEGNKEFLLYGRH